MKMKIMKNLEGVAFRLMLISIVLWGILWAAEKLIERVQRGSVEPVAVVSVETYIKPGLAGQAVPATAGPLGFKSKNTTN